MKSGISSKYIPSRNSTLEDEKPEPPKNLTTSLNANSQNYLGGKHIRTSTEESQINYFMSPNGNHQKRIQTEMSAQPSFRGGLSSARVTDRLRTFNDLQSPPSSKVVDNFEDNSMKNIFNKSAGTKNQLTIKSS